eukprot:TRINITY_DN22099_c0_g1_i1.p1 TRINITY_DN22099_c0_g1~~TRINITY_DN22099_c0_g1_i1.p1  ORF type:complete len:383 (+),score=79.84 TRINITY_DN22099_c0_g1_i1:68-1216(+)
MISSRYELRVRIDKGAFGQVHEGYDVKLRRRCAVKLSTGSVGVGGEDRITGREIAMYKAIAKLTPGTPGFAQLWDTGVDRGRNFLVLELLGPSLHSLVAYCGKIGLKSCLMLGMQILQVVKTFHELGWVHRDLKPHNFVMGRGAAGNVVHLIDFGLCTSVERSEKKAQSLKHQSVRTPLEKGLTGTPAFIAVATHLTNMHTRNTDLEQLCYTIAYLANGKLPWVLDLKKVALYKFKTRSSRREIMGDSPCAFHALLSYSRSRTSASTPPDYERFDAMLQEEFEECGYVKDFQFDWFDISGAMQKNPALSHKDVVEQRMAMIDRSDPSILGQSMMLNQSVLSRSRVINQAHHGSTGPSSLSYSGLNAIPEPPKSPRRSGSQPP